MTTIRIHEVKPASVKALADEYRDYIATYVTRKGREGAAVLPVLAAHLALLAAPGDAVHAGAIDALLPGGSPLAARLASKMNAGFITTALPNIDKGAVFVAHAHYMLPARKGAKRGALVKMTTGEPVPAGAIVGPFLVRR
jgi:hypothetical protein